MTAGAGARGRREPVTREQVVAAAVELADAEGVDALSIRKLAQRVGLKPMSLYHHVADKDDLLDGMVDVVFSEIELPPADADWRTAMRQRATSARSALARHHWAIGLMESRTSPGPANLRHHDTLLGILRRAEFSIVAATQVLSILDSYIYGFTLQEATLPFGSPDELEQVAEAIVALMPADEYPNLRQAATELAASGFDYAEQFDVGLELILDGLGQLRGADG